MIVRMAQFGKKVSRWNSTIAIIVRFYRMDARTHNQKIGVDNDRDTYKNYSVLWTLNLWTTFAAMYYKQDYRRSQVLSRFDYVQ